MDMTMPFEVPAGDDGSAVSEAGTPRASPRAVARLLEYGAGRHVALPAAATVELVDCPRRVFVPGLPPHCLGLVAWQERWIPLLDLALLLNAGADAPAPPSGHVLVVAWQPAPGQPLEFAALAAPRLVRMARVDDRQQCGLPVDSPWWAVLAMACFEFEGKPVPVLDPARVFGRPLG